MFFVVCSLLFNLPLLCYGESPGPCDPAFSGYPGKKDSFRTQPKTRLEYLNSLQRRQLLQQGGVTITTRGHNQNMFGIFQLITEKVTLTTRGGNKNYKGRQPQTRLEYPNSIQGRYLLQQKGGG